MRVLDADPGLGAAISADQWDAAAAAAVAPAFEFDRGPWRFTPPPDRISLGALVISGMLVVQIDAGIRWHAELLGPEDVISPWVGVGDALATLSSVNASVVARLRIALLDGRFAARTARWPEISAALIQRLIVRSRRLSLQAAINSIPRIDERLELTLWELANRFGHVTRDGITLTLPLTHSQLAGMLAAQRPSVSTALGRLQSLERVVHTGRHTWLLPGEPPQALSSLARQTGLHA